MLNHQLPSGLRHGSQSKLCKGMAMDGPNVSDGQMALNGVFSLYVGNLPQISTRKWGADLIVCLKKEAMTSCGACVMVEDLV